MDEKIYRQKIDIINEENKMIKTDEALKIITKSVGREYMNESMHSLFPLLSEEPIDAAAFYEAIWKKPQGHGSIHPAEDLRKRNRVICWRRYSWAAFCSAFRSQQW